MKLLSVTVPCYNSQAYMEKCVDSLLEGGDQVEILIVDDGSVDDTAKIADDYAARFPGIVKAIHQENGGHGAAILYGYRYSIEHGADYIFQTDSDGQTLPEEFGQFWQRRKAYDMVIGHRKGRQDGASRVFVTKMLRLVIRICFHVTVTDANTPYRLMRSEALDASLELIPESFNLSNVMISVIFAKKQLPVRYIPITFRPRQGGVNSINLKKICKIGRQAVRDFREMNRKLAGAAEKD